LKKRLLKPQAAKASVKTTKTRFLYATLLENKRLLLKSYLLSTV